MSRCAGHDAYASGVGAEGERFRGEADEEVVEDSHAAQALRVQRENLGQPSWVAAGAYRDDRPIASHRSNSCDRRQPKLMFSAITIQ